MLALCQIIGHSIGIAELEAEMKTKESLAKFPRGGPAGSPCAGPVQEAPEGSKTDGFVELGSFF
jgi:hypothetical protein